MKKILFTLIILPLFNYGQQTFIPDNNFEQALINLGYDNLLNDSILTSSIDTLKVLSVQNQNILSLTGIEDFFNLRVLRCSNNQISDINLSNNILLRHIYCGGNQLTELNLSSNDSLRILKCGNNPIISLDLSNNFNLIQLFSRNCNLTNLNIKNGNNIILDSLSVTGNPNLNCIEVNNINYFNNNFTVSSSNIDPQHYFSNTCNVSLINDQITFNKIIMTTDLLGRETNKTNQPLLYIYQDGKIERKIIIP